TLAAVASTKPDPAAGLAIAAPYTLAPLPAAIETGLEAAMSQAMGALSAAVEVGARTADKDGASQAYVLGMRIPGVPVTSPTFLDSVATGAAGTSGVVTKTTVGGHDVRVVTAASGTAQLVFILGDRIILIAGGSKDSELAVTAALVSANP